jgi:hypothetical protein
MAKRRKRKLRKGVLFFLLLLIVGGIGTYLVLSGKIKFDKVEDKIKEVVETPIKKIQIVNEDSNSRPVAVMINNHPSARKYHTGLQDAYLAYEIIVEGGYTRYMAIYKDQETEKIGSVRSARHYFLDYALENDAVYIHWGYSPQASKEMESYHVDHFDGIKYENKYFFRDRTLNVSLEHTGFTSIELIKKGISDLGFRTETNKDILLNYSADSVKLNKMNDTIEALEVIIPYSGVVTTSYKYDADKGVYLRSVNDKAHEDYSTKEQFSVKNIITYQVSNHTLTGDVKGRQDIDNLGTGTGYYISEGYAVPIKWEKKYKTSQTVYTYMDGTEINVNDGNTWIHIQPSSRELTINGQKES